MGGVSNVFEQCFYGFCFTVHPLHMVVKLIPRLISVPDSKRKSSEAKSDTIFKLKNLKVPKSDLWEDLFSVPTVDSFITGFDYDPIFDFMM